MKLFIGLGNSGKEYEKTRHNAGFLCIDFLRKKWGFDAFAIDNKMSAATSDGMLGKEKALLVKPHTFMNGSGSAVQKLMHFYKILPSDIAVIHDDLDIAPGTFKVTSSSRSAGHNGVQDIIDKLGTQDFFRIRIGIGKPPEIPGPCPPESLRKQVSRESLRAGISAHDFVLQNFSPAELRVLALLFPKIESAILHRTGL